MPRSNRPRRGGSPAADDGGDEDLSRVLYGSLRVEPKCDGLWNVQSVSAVAAAKFYTCPGCSLEIAPKTPHIVAWRADGLMGEADDVAARRHWHSHCWKIR